MVAHGNLRFEGTNRFQRYADDNQNRGTAKGDICLRNHREDDRENSNQTKEDSAHEGDLRNNLREVINSGLSGANTGDCAVVFANRVRNFYGVELDRGVEVVERQDQQEVQHAVDHIVIMEKTEKLFPETALSRSHKRLNHAGQRHKRHCKDDRQDTGHVDLNRNEGRLAAIHLASDNPFSIGYRNSSFRVGHEDDESNHRNENDDNQRDDEVVLRFLRAEFPPGSQRHEGVRAAGKDTGKKDDRDTIANTMLGDLIAHPHNQHRAGYETGHNHNRTEDSGETGVVIQYAVLVAQDKVVHNAHCNRKTEGGVTGDPLDLLLTVVAFLCKTLKRRNGNGQKLNDNRCVNVRCD